MPYFLIKTQAEYQEALDFISSDLELYDFELSQKMTSYEYNLYLQDIQYYLNILYEKTRTIEDLLDYLDNYSSQKLNTLLNELEQSESKLTNIVDKYVSNKSKTYEVFWDEGNLDSIKDRDGADLPKAKVYRGIDNYLGVGSFEKNKLEIKNIVKTSNIPTYSDNILSCLSDGYYLSSYNIDQPQEIKENIFIELNDNENARFLNLRPINCKIEYKGLNKESKVHYVITSNMMNKTKENFEYKNYLGSNLNKSLSEENFTYNSAKDINQNQNNKIDVSNTNNTDNYYNDVLDYQKTKKIQDENSLSLSIYKS